MITIFKQLENYKSVSTGEHASAAIRLDSLELQVKRNTGQMVELRVQDATQSLRKVITRTHTLKTPALVSSESI